VKVSVVVLSFTQLEFVKRLVKQLLEQDYPAADYEVLVVDNGSRDGTAAWLNSQRKSRLNSVVLEQALSRAAGRNRGIQAARGELLIMIDSDHTVQSDFISSHVRAHSRGPCAVVGKSDYAEHPDLIALNSYLNGCGAVKYPSGTKLPGRYFTTANCSILRQSLLAVGLFDETFDKWGGEDLDLGMRLEHAGIPIYGDHESLAIHHHFRSLKDVLKNKQAFGEAGIPLLLKKHPQLFRELNLDRVFKNPHEPNRFGALYRAVFRLACSRPIYLLARAFANINARRPLPRFIFDYLHLRQYISGYSRFLNSQS